MRKTLMTMIAMVAIASTTFVGCDKEPTETGKTTSKADMESPVKQVDIESPVKQAEKEAVNAANDGDVVLTSDNKVKEDKDGKTPTKTEPAKADGDKSTTEDKSNANKSEPTKTETKKPTASDKKPSTSKPNTTAKPAHTHTWVTVTDKPAWSEKVLVKAAHTEKVVAKKAWSEKVLVKEGWSEKTLVKDAYTEKVVTKDAWSEKVLVKAEVVEEIPFAWCTRTDTDEVRKFYNLSELRAYRKNLLRKGISTCVRDDVETKVTPAEYKTVNHPAEYKTVKHPAEYKTVNRPAEYKTVNHPAVTHQECKTCGAKK